MYADPRRCTYHLPNSDCEQAVPSARRDPCGFGQLSNPTNPFLADLLEIVEERYGRGATIFTSQIPVDRWHDLIGDPTIADAILDRIVHTAHRLKLRGDSLRKKAAANPQA